MPVYDRHMAQIQPMKCKRKLAEEEGGIGNFSLPSKKKQSKRRVFLHLSSVLLLRKLFYEEVILHTAGTIRVDMIKAFLKKEGRP